MSWAGVYPEDGKAVAGYCSAPLETLRIEWRPISVWAEEGGLGKKLIISIA